MKKNFVSGWYVLYTRPNNEKRVSLSLSEKKINHYLPLTKVLRVRNDRKRLVESPMFPSYLFIYLNEIKDYFTGYEAGGVVNYVKFGKQIAMVDNHVINNLKIMTDTSAKMEISSERFWPGKRLIIKEGVLIGLDCEVVQHQEKEKILVRVDLLNRNILIDMPIDSLSNIHVENL